MINTYDQICEVLKLCKHINDAKDSKLTIKLCITVNQSLENFCEENNICGSCFKFFCNFPIKEYENYFTIGE